MFSCSTVTRSKNACVKKLRLRNTKRARTSRTRHEAHPYDEEKGETKPKRKTKTETQDRTLAEINNKVNDMYFLYISQIYILIQKTKNREEKSHWVTLGTREKRKNLGSSRER